MIRKSIKYILLMDLADKYSFYGMQAILPSFLLNIALFTQTQTIVVMQASITLTYLFMLLCTFVAGRKFQYKSLMLFAAITSFLGHYTLSASNQNWNVFIGIFCISIGSGIIQICMPSMITAECEEDQKKISRSMSLVYLFTNIGTFSIIITPLIYNKFGHSLAFLSPTLAMLMATIFLLIGFKYYKKIELNNNSNILNFDKTIFKKILPFIIILSVFYSLMAQIYSSWVIQGEKMEYILLDYKIAPSQMQFLNTIFVVTLLPLILFKIIPLLQHCNIFRTIKSQINIGLIFAIIAFILISIIQYFLDSGICIHLLAQTLPYFFISVAEILVRVITINYLFSSYGSKKATFIGLVIAIFGFISNSFFTSIFSFFTGISWLFFIFCAFILFLLLIFSFLYLKSN